MTPALQDFLDQAAETVNSGLDALLPSASKESDDPGRLYQAMHYAVLGGGKRIRPALVFAAAESCGGTWQQATPAACAVELLHAYTLVHDDMPDMDDDDLRRGRPTVHRAFGTSTALLAGDALLTLAFATLAKSPGDTARAVGVLAERSGANQLLLGQAIDLNTDWNRNPSMEQIEQLHRLKTGALFAAATELGGLCAGADDDRLADLAEFGMTLGVAFQHADDLKDNDFPSLKAQSEARLLALAGQAKEIAGKVGGNTSSLAKLAQWVAVAATQAP